MTPHAIHRRTGSAPAALQRPAAVHVWTAARGHWPARQRAALAVAAVVLLTHALLLGQWTLAPAPGAERHQRHHDEAPAMPLRRVLPAVQVQIRRDAVPLPGATAGAPRATTALSDTALPRRAAKAAAPAGPTAPAVSTVPATSATAAVPATATSQPPATATATAAALASDANPDMDATAVPPLDRQPSGSVRVPTYATRLPPPTTLQFAWRRGALAGRAELIWQTDGARYALSLRGRASPAPALAWHSEGVLDAHGIAPERYAEWRRGRALRAANFQRGGGGVDDQARITFSGPQVQHPLLAGAQDRLSWMLQLPAVLAADPALHAPGSTVQLFVAGARGDAEVWLFTVEGLQPVTLADGSSVQALHLQREPRRPYDTRADIWLDPVRSHLPVRVLLTVRPSGDTSEFVLEPQPAP